MKVIVDMFDLGFKELEATKEELDNLIELNPDYKDRVYLITDQESEYSCNGCHFFVSEGLCYHHDLPVSCVELGIIFIPYTKGE